MRSFYRDLLHAIRDIFFVVVVSFDFGHDVRVGKKWVSIDWRALALAYSFKCTA